MAEHSSDFVFDKNKFTRKGKFSFKHHLTFLCFNKGTSNQAELEDFVENDFTKELEVITRQAYSKQRIHIKPTIFKEISNQYLININYTIIKGNFINSKTNEKSIHYCLNAFLLITKTLFASILC